jgi:hypothetical protein
MFIDQSKRFPFPKVTPIRLPAVIESVKKHYSYESADLKYLEDVFRKWYSPLIDLDQFSYMYFLNNGITQGLEYMSIHYRNKDVKMQLGDYFWLKTIGVAKEVSQPEPCEISYASVPSARNGSITVPSWDSKIHILDGAYIGTTPIKTTVPNNTEIVLLGFSKNLGIPELRLGLMFSKNKIPTLEGIQKVFSYVGTMSFRTVAKVCEEISILDLATLLKDVQVKYCSAFPEYRLIPSDSAILALTENDKFNFYKRSDGTIRVPLGESITKWLIQS